MADVVDVKPIIPTVTPSTAQPLARRPLLVVAAAFVVTQAVFLNQYGYDPDEMYFRMLGAHGLTWGYVDEPPLLPLVANISRHLFGDSMWGIRIPAVICGAAIIVIATLIAAEFGGGRRAQLITSLGMATSMTCLEWGHWILTSSFDTVFWCLVLLFAVRALLRDDGRWWIYMGVSAGLGTYAKWMVMYCVGALLLGLILIGPRHHFRQRWIYLGLGAGAILALPNFLYQALNHFPELQMAHAMGILDGPSDRALFPTNLLFVLGPALLVIALCGIVGIFRRRQWRPIRALAVGYVLSTGAAYLTNGGRPDYTDGLLIALFCAGAVSADAWIEKGLWRKIVLVGGMGLMASVQALLALPLVSIGVLAHMQINSMTLETIGWPTEVREVSAVYHSLSPTDRAHAIVLTDNFGEAGAIDRYGPAYRLPQAYSGINEMYLWGPPPADATIAVVVGAISKAKLAADFQHCTVATHLNDQVGIYNPEYGVKVDICRGLRAPWRTLWPGFHHLSAYE